MTELQRRLADAEQRAARNAECAQRQVEIHMTLLHAAHDAATESRDETRADAERLREQLATTARELADARERVGLQAERHQAELALVREQAAARAEDGRRALAFVRAEASAERALPRRRAPRACERAGGGAGAASPLRRRAGTGALARRRRGEPRRRAPRRRPDAPPRGRSAHAAGLGGAAGGAMLRELQQWAVDGGDAAAAAAARTAKLHERLARVEAAADAASVGFDALQREHVLLQKRYRKLQAHGANVGLNSISARPCSPATSRRIRLYQRTTLFTCRIAPPLEITIGRCGAPFTASAAPVAAASPSAGALGCSRSLGRGCSLHSSRKASRLA